MAVYERTTFGDVRLFISSKTSVASSLHCCLDSLVSLSLPFESCFLFCFCFSNERQEGEGISSIPSGLTGLADTPELGLYQVGGEVLVQLAQLCLGHV